MRENDPERESRLRISRDRNFCKVTPLLPGIGCRGLPNFILVFRDGL